MFIKRIVIYASVICLSLTTCVLASKADRDFINVDTENTEIEKEFTPKLFHDQFNWRIFNIRDLLNLFIPKDTDNLDHVTDEGNVSNSLDAGTTTIEIIEVQEEVEINLSRLVDLGEFRLTAYCPCVTCCEIWSSDPLGKTTAIGVGAYEGVTIAVDPKIISYGSKVYIEGVGVRIASDRGGGIKGKRLDVYFTNHADAKRFGVVKSQVYLIEEF